MYAVILALFTTSPDGANTRSPTKIVSVFSKPRLALIPGDSPSKITVSLLPGSDDQIPLCSCVDDISSADNAHQFAIVQEGDALDGTFGEEHRHLAHRSLFAHGDDCAAHNITCDHRTYSLQLY